METSEVLALLGILLTFSGLLFAAFRHLRGSVESVRQTMSEKNGEIHKKIDDVKEKFVRKDDMLNHIDRLERAVDGLRSDMQDNTGKILDALTRER